MLKTCLEPGETIVKDYIFSKQRDKHARFYVAPTRDSEGHISGLQIVAERPMYFSYGPGWTGGHDVLGTFQPRTEWFFPEGCTHDNFDEFICIANPGDETANVNLTFMLDEGDPIEINRAIAAHQRITVRVFDEVARGRDVSTRIRSDKPVVVERPMYFNYGTGWDGGHAVVGYAP